jgi:branched-chain amino acid transport system permease protein
VNAFLAFTLTGLFTGAAYAIAASGLVLTYTTTRVFNLAHGATSMLMAFLYWQLHVAAGLPTFVAIGLVLFVIAPLYGVLLQKFVMKGLGDAPVSVSLVVTLGLFVLLIGVAQQFWPATVGRSVTQFYGYESFTLGTFRVSFHYVITIVLSGLVAGGLYYLLNRTRVGTSMRASVDNPELLQLFGQSSDRVSMASWATGSSLAGLAGIMLVSVVGLDYYNLTFLVIAAFAAAMLGRLQSLPLTFLGALALGLFQSYAVGYGPQGQLLQGLQTSLPTLMLFVILIFVPQVRLRVGQVKGIVAANVPSARRALNAAGGFAVAIMLFVPLLDATNTQRLGIALAYGITMLSLVLLTGYGGYVSLAQLAFVGVGAATVAKMNTTSPFAVLMAVLIAAAVGALVALPVLRLTGLYLALATLAFGQLMDKLVFQANFMFGYNGSITAKRMSLFGITLGSPTGSSAAYVVLMAVVFTAVGLGILMLRRGPIGRLLIAMRDSQAACGTLGLNMRWFRVGLFSASAGIAGLAGALLAGLRGSVSALDFQTFSSLLVLLLAVVAGVTTITGAFLGGVMLMLLPVLQATFPSAAGLVFLVVGFGAIMLGRDPNGLANLFFRMVRTVAPRIPMLQRWQQAPDPEGARPPSDLVQAEMLQSVTEGQVAGHGVA